MKDYRKIMKELAANGYNHYLIHKKTGIGYETLRRLRDKDGHDPRVSTHNEIMILHNRVVSKQDKEQ